MRGIIIASLSLIALVLFMVGSPNGFYKVGLEEDSGEVTGSEWFHVAPAGPRFEEHYTDGEDSYDASYSSTWGTMESDLAETLDEADDLSAEDRESLEKQHAGAQMLKWVGFATIPLPALLAASMFSYRHPVLGALTNTGRVLAFVLLALVIVLGFIGASEFASGMEGAEGFGDDGEEAKLTYGGFLVAGAGALLLVAMIMGLLPNRARPTPESTDQAEPTYAEPEPTYAEPTQAEPTYAEPAYAEPAYAETRSLRCPKCAAVSRVPVDQKPSCGSCGYGA